MNTEIRHCHKCTIQFRVGNPYNLKNIEFVRCPECQLCFHSIGKGDRTVVCMVPDDEHKDRLSPGPYVPPALKVGEA